MDGIGSATSLSNGAGSLAQRKIPRPISPSYLAELLNNASRAFKTKYCQAAREGMKAVVGARYNF
jgi:hypothetical protein